MAENSLFPAFFQVAYHSPFGAHKMIVPTLEWNVGIGTNGHGGYVAHDGTTSVDAQDMIENLLNDLKVFIKADSAFDVVTIYTMTAKDAPRNPVTTWSPGIVGTNVATTQRKAVQQTWNFRTTTFGKFKLTLLDGPIGSDFEKILPAGMGSDDLAIIGALTDLTKAFAGRDGSPPAAAISKTLTLNDKLRREYGMS